MPARWTASWADGATSLFMHPLGPTHDQRIPVNLVIRSMVGCAFSDRKEG